MAIKFKITKEGATAPEFKNGIGSIKAHTIKHGVGKDHRMVVVYESGVEVEIPDNKIGMLIPAKNAYLGSLEFAGGTSILEPGFNGEIIAMFKTNTDSVPSIFEAGDEFARLIILDYNSFEVETEEDIKQEDELEVGPKEENSEPAEEENAVVEEIK